MSKAKSKEMVDDRLKHIANVLLLNASFTDNIGLLNGKMGIAIFFYHYSRFTKSKIFEEYAGNLIDEIYEEINQNTSVDFTKGLTGIGWGIEYLVKNGFVDADTDKALSEVDITIGNNSLHRPFLLDNGNDFFGYGLYYLVRLSGREKDDNNLNSLIKKHYLIILTDDCERILVKKQYSDYNIQSLSIDTINSFTWFLLEMYRLQLFPVKVEKIFQIMPEYIEICLQSSVDKAGYSQLLYLTERITTCIVNTQVKETLNNILNKYNTPLKDAKTCEDDIVNDFIKNTWQKIVYKPYISKCKGLLEQMKKVSSIIGDEENWNRRLENLNNENLGLTGLAGLGLGLLKASMSLEKERDKS